MTSFARLSDELHQVATGLANLLVSTRYARPMCSVTVRDALVEVQVHASAALLELDQVERSTGDIVAPPRAG